MYFIISSRFSDKIQKLIFYLVFGKKYDFRMLSLESDIFTESWERALELTAG
jgi:hypothetical protein